MQVCEAISSRCISLQIKLNGDMESAKYQSDTIHDIEDNQIFGMNMLFISSSEAKNAYFMSGEATNEIYIFSLHEMK